MFAGFLSIPIIKKLAEKREKNKKEKNRTDKKQNLKVSIIAFSLAFATVASSFIPAFFGKKKNNNVKQTKNESIVEEVTSVSEPEFYEIPVEETESIVEDNNISFDDKVIIDDNAYIY